jgi:hypothetical protein
MNLIGLYVNGGKTVRLKKSQKQKHTAETEKRGVIEKHGPHKQQETKNLPFRGEMMMKNLRRKGQQQRRDCHR